MDDEQAELFETVPVADPKQAMRELLLRWWRPIETVRDEEGRI